MRLKSFGCSFIFGNELPDDGGDGPYATSSRLTWPSLLANHLGLEYDCYAQPGSGNLRIAERVLSQAACNEKNLYVIGWSWIDRFDYTQPNDVWSTVTPIDDSAIAHTYYRELHSQYRDKLSSLMAIYSCITTLQRKGCPYIMTYQDDLLWETKWHATPAITDLQDFCRPELTDFEGQTFLEWSKSKNFPVSQKLHPLQEAHAAGADYLIANLETVIKNQRYHSA